MKLLLLVFFSFLTGFEVTFGDENGAAPEPYVKIVDQTVNSALLQCKVRGAFPKPKLHWQDSDGNILHAEEPKVTERGGRYDVILQTTVTKTDNYRCVATQEEIKHQIYAETYVYIHKSCRVAVVFVGGWFSGALTVLGLFEVAKWIIKCRKKGPDVVEVVVEEGSDAILPCSLSTKERITSNVFDWKKDDQKEVFFYDGEKHYNNGRSGQDKQFKGRVSHFPGELKSGNASIIIRNTRMEDSGNYTCVFPHLQPSQLFHIKLVVEHTFKDRSGEIRGAARKPYVKTLNQTADWALLQCEVRDASPKPKLHWQDSDGNILHAEEPKVTERGDVILQTTVTKTNNYRCVATQEEIKHQTYAETYVFIPEKLVEDKSCHGAGVLVGVLFSGALPVAAAWVLFEVAKWIIKRRKKAPKSSVKRLDNKGIEADVL